jgi:hypothetical protein
MALESSVLQSGAAQELREQDLLRRIRAEYDDMPGVNLTLQQASRLFSVDADTCARALVRLVAAGVLSVDEGAFVRRGRRRPRYERRRG